MFPDILETNPTEGFTVIVVDVKFEHPFELTDNWYDCVDVGDANGLGADGFVKPVVGVQLYVIGEPTGTPVTVLTSWVLVPEQMVLVTGLTETLSVGLTVIVIDAHPELNWLPLKFLAKYVVVDVGETVMEFPNPIWVIPHPFTYQ